MALSEREQQVLRDLEQQLHEDDPGLASSIERAGRTMGRPSPRHVGAGVALVLTGLAVVIGGVAVGRGLVSMLIGVVGFSLAVWGVTLMLTRTQGSSAEGAQRGARRGQGFMERQSERWERRREDNR
ncbi:MULTISPECIES: DUF3040 domain-containing protein [unclassified Actinomyces]|uniref:DUF3040 domain-containing protein n=1 Tax=unclassified Actinomyces TaxID=2609248 RepID=UPI0020170894|nr:MULTISPECIES: DUF3040 domain-containing protein [unclassified Actinomyces]MCL3778258.1 DUF3040 domain-containing protein [Actinomyces sp. AC-20-1]MCL3790436.1 DUF3040 domain-containing protein [Actinomyces sp. 187325]MCL3792713.1 DUF3040 domain-containing protein [Actinomyces sp. 186855]MCL3795193.1 DUF3040 domain-containing protein [Actinomyces sp. 217892]